MGSVAACYFCCDIHALKPGRECPDAAGVLNPGRVF